MRAISLFKVACFGLAWLAPIAVALPAKADDFGKHFTVNVAPVYVFSSNGDAVSPPPKGDTGLGYTNDNPIASTFRFNYGLAFKIDGKTNLAFAHANYAYQLGRILTAAPKTSLVTGAIYDYVDSVTLSRSGLAPGLSVHLSYNSHQRQDVTGLCLNQKYCVGPGGSAVRNPLSINEMYYTAGGSYTFGPKSKIGQIFTVGADLKYVPRGPTPESPAVALGGLGKYVGTQTLFPWSVTALLPIFNSSTVIPFVNYTSLPVLYHDSAVPEEYRGVVFGLVKVINKNMTLSYTNLNLQSCRCVARVPAPDNLRLAFGILSLDLHTGL